MLTHIKLLALVSGAALAVALAPAPQGATIQLDEAAVFIEYNSTDQDVGIQFAWDGEPWKTMRVLAPDSRTALHVKAGKGVKEQGLTEGFFESGEPSLVDLPWQDFLDRFPEGEYAFQGTTLEGDRLEGKAAFSHLMPAAPVNLSPAHDGLVPALAPLPISFDPVTQDLQGGPLDPELYEVVVESEGDPRRTFSITLPGDTNTPMVTLPHDFMLPATQYKLEVIVQAENGNRSITETLFSTSP